MRLSWLQSGRQADNLVARIGTAATPVFADIADIIERRFESHIINVRPDRTRYRSLTDTNSRSFAH